MDLVALTLEDYRALVARFGEHGNSHRRMMGALREAGASAALERLRALRRMERRFDVDLGALCWRVEHRDDPATHPIERWVLDYVTRRSREGRARPVPESGRSLGLPLEQESAPHADATHLWVMLDRLREVRAWIDEGRMVPESEG